MFNVVPAQPRYLDWFRCSPKVIQVPRRVFHITRLFINRVMCSVTQTSPLRLLWSFTLLGQFWSTLVPSVYFSPFGPFSPPCSIALSLVHFGPLLHFCPLVQFSPSGPFAPLWSRRSSPFSPFGPLQSISSTMLNPVHFGPIQTIC